MAAAVAYFVGSLLRKDTNYCCHKLRVFYHVRKIASRELYVT
jgi:hypothetical protein